MSGSSAAARRRKPTASSHGGVGKAKKAGKFRVIDRNKNKNPVLMSKRDRGA